MRGDKMKQWIRKAVLSVLLVLSVVTLAACGTKEVKTAPMDAATQTKLEESGKQYMENIAQLTPDEIQSTIDSAEKSKDAVVFNGLTNFKNDLDRLGTFQSVDSATATATEDGYSIDIESTYSDRTLKLTLGLSEDLSKITEMTFEPTYSLGEEIADAAGNLVLGMGSVFIILIFIAWIISLFKYIKVFEDRKKNKQSAEAPAAPVKPAPAPVKAAPVKPQAGNELQAVIAAAIAQYEADTSNSTDTGFVPGPTLNNGLVVRSIRRRGFSVSAAQPMAPTVTASAVAAAPAPTAAEAAPAASQAKTESAPAASGTAGSIEVTSPMPGKILAVKKNPGDAVKAGDPILVLEAMKMENDIVAPQDGTVASINVSVGDAVESGATLATMN
jgi:sodium pump decarboxylase gamma subunit